MALSAPERFANIQALRGLAALMVALSHLQVVEGRAAIDPLMPDWSILGFAGVDLFFVISGFVMVHVTRGRFGSGREAGAFAFARAARVYPLYWLVSAVVLVVWLRDPNLVFASIPGDPDLVRSFLLWPDERPPLHAVGWTLVHELYFYAVFALLLLAPERLLPVALAAWGGLVAALNLSGAGGLGPEAALITHPLTFEFLMGAGAALAFHRWGPVRPGLALAAGAGSFVAVCFAFAVMRPGVFPEGWLRAFAFGLPAALTLYGAAGLERSGRTAPPWTARYGDWSYALYLIHILALAAVGKVWALPPQTPQTVDNILIIGDPE